jgi:hypothetical protein
MGVKTADDGKTGSRVRERLGLIDGIMKPVQLRQLKTALSKQDWKAVAEVGSSTKSLEVGKMAVEAVAGAGKWDALGEIGRYGCDKVSFYAIDVAIALEHWDIAGYIGRYGRQQSALYAIEAAVAFGRWDVVSRIGQSEIEAVGRGVVEIAVREGRVDVLDKMGSWFGSESTTDYAQKECDRLMSELRHAPQGDLPRFQKAISSVALLKKENVDSAAFRGKADNVAVIARFGSEDAAKAAIDAIVEESWFESFKYACRGAPTQLTIYAVNSALKKASAAASPQLAQKWFAAVKDATAGRGIEGGQEQ